MRVMELITFSKTGRHKDDFTITQDDSHKNFEQRDIYIIKDDKSRILPLQSHTKENNDIIHYLFEKKILERDGTSLVHKKYFDSEIGKEVIQQTTIIAKKIKEKLEAKRNKIYDQNTDNREKKYTTTSGGFATELPEFKYEAIKIIYTKNAMVISALDQYLNLEFCCYKNIPLSEDDIKGTIVLKASILNKKKY